MDISAAAHRKIPGSGVKLTRGGSTLMDVPLVIVDGANVVGSVPDGWWRDRAGAAVRLRDRLAGLTEAGFADLPGPVEMVLVVEGRARDIPATPGVRVERAPGSGDDKIVELVASAGTDRRVVVITADRGLRDRVTTPGAGGTRAEVRGPSSLPARRGE
jgi:hypothetical protein